ncbi:MAG: methionyl-tRNA formyltransferase [Clostridiales bacterium]|nr:methionyl-tRNA formyltransferase [Clostridiales bacterium]
MRIVFMGTPDFSVPTLQALVASKHEIAAVVTQPDKPKGRGKAVQMSPVKVTALAYGIPVLQPVRARDEDFIGQIRELAPDVCVVIAFGQILPEELLQIPRYGCVNIHASLLPKYRGASPIQWAVINGDEESGVTTMMMDAGMDTGDMLEKRVIRLDPTETGGSLSDRLSILGGDLILSTLDKIEKGTAVRTPQDHGQATYVKKIPKSLGEIDWTMSAGEIERLIRGLNPWPSAYTYYKGKFLKIWEAGVMSETVDSQASGGGQPEAGSDRHRPSENIESAFCGEVIGVEGDRLNVQTGNGVLSITALQLEGKKRMDTAAFLRGYPVRAGERLGRVPAGQMTEG